MKNNRFHKIASTTTRQYEKVNMSIRTSPTVTTPFTSWLRNAKRSLRVTSVVAIVALLHAVLFPHLAMAQDGMAQQKAAEKIVLQGTSEQQMNQALLQVQEAASEKQKTITERLQEESGTLDSVLSFFGLSALQLEELDSLEQLNNLLLDLHQTALDNFAETEAQLLEKNLPDSILQRHRDTVADYQTQYNAMHQQLNAAIQSDNLTEQGEAIDALNNLMAPQKLKRSHQKVDPNNLPWGTPDASKTRKPAQTAEQLSSLTGISPFPQGTQVAANIITPEMLGQLGGPVAEDLAETPDIQFTDAIRAKALELEEDPVKIYNWVRNNIEFIPSYGSIQGADYTLQHGKGNAFDTASLLIALYRAANIPARYAYGTVQVPADKVMNWVGGVDVPEAAQQLLGQGGIPNVGLIQAPYVRLVVTP